VTGLKWGRWRKVRNPVHKPNANKQKKKKKEKEIALRVKIIQSELVRGNSERTLVVINKSHGKKKRERSGVSSSNLTGGA